ncbi:protein involved in gliding motility EpsB [Filimonas lacunae]|uniref:non-specific protein-tyrosine kinase n=1 Tax=Filimonas lacunae TaxID=477680 RepID=A0A173MNV7_9BACT|nr:tyrosine-protein kinase [Filimonas lacunae]BAV09130.1 tyrosine-protein kinase Wzc [Filimonas lacunae]SIS67686.1 protein involved in gliding motility EpsB [Filimonas lacunae]
MDSENVTEQHQKDGQTFSTIFSFVLDHWKIFLLCILFSLVGGWFYLKIATPVYKVTAKILVDDDQKAGSLFGASSNVMQDFNSLLGGKSNVDNESQVLQTQDLMERVVKDMQLNVKYFEQKDLVYREMYPETAVTITAVNSIGAGSAVFTLSEQEDGAIKVEEQVGKTDTSASIKETHVAKFGYPINMHSGIYQFNKSQGYIKGRKYKVTISTLDKSIEELQHMLSVKVPNKQVTTINLELAYPVPAKGRSILATLVKQYINGNLDQKNAFADSTMTFIDRRLAIVNADLSQVERQVQDFKQRHNIADMDEQAKVLIHQWEQQGVNVNSINTELSLVDTLTRMFTNQNFKNKMVPGLLTKDPVFLELLAIYNENQLLREKLLSNFTPNNPQIKNIDVQLEGLRAKMLDHLTVVRKGLMVSFNQLDSIGGSNTVNIRKVPEIQRNYLDLVRQQEIKQALFVFLLQKREEIAVTKASNIANSRLIDSPRAEYRPVWPKKPLVMLMALLLGIVIPYFGLSAINMLNNRVKSSDEVIALSQIGLVGEISHSEISSPLIYKEKPDSIIAEQFRAIRTNLQFVNGTVKCPVILFTSSLGGEGKSFAALNLAQAFASTGKKTVLMELDLRKPKVASYLNIDAENGFSNYMVSNLPLYKIIVPSGIEKLDLLPSGPLPPNPAELLLHEKMNDLIAELRDSYDVIIMDTPPVGLVTDAQILASYATTCLYMVRIDYTYKNRLTIPLELKTSGKMKNIYLVINDVKRKASHRYGYGGYKYDEEYGYGSKQKNTKPRVRVLLKEKKQG